MTTQQQIPSEVLSEIMEATELYGYGTYRTYPGQSNIDQQNRMIAFMTKELEAKAGYLPKDITSGLANLIVPGICYSMREALAD